MRIFLSYGHDDYTSLASRVKRDLEAHGHEVWFDVERLKTGRDWEQYIDDGVNWASAVPDAGRFLLLLTPHSVRRPDGYCLNELARAYARNLPIVPVMVSTVEPPLSICRLQWLDMRHCFPTEQHEEQYAKQFEQLVKALADNVPFEGVQQRLLNALRPISYDDDLSRHLKRFTGRDWLKAEVEEWLASPKRVLWITAEAGMGKSAFAAWLCDKRPEIAAYHFCHFGNSDRMDARRALFSLAYQLSTQLPVYQERLNASPSDETILETNVPAVFDRLFVNLLTDATPLTDKPHVLLIDALDEATSKGRNDLASLIGAEFDRLPTWLRLIVTSRPYEEVINTELQTLDAWKLDAGRPENLNDIRTYLRRELRPFTGNEAPPEDVVAKITNKSEGLFLYVSLVREELERGRLSLAQLEQFPKGLGGVYLQWFQRYFPELAVYQSDWRPALEAICAAREPLRRDYLEEVMGWSSYKMDSLAEQLGSLFPFIGEDQRVRPVHRSVRDWLTDRKRSGSYRVDTSTGEQRLADFALKQYCGGVGSMSAYSIVHAPSHLAACQRNAELQEVLVDPDWIGAKLKAGGIVSLLTDYDLAMEVLGPKRHAAVPDSPMAVPIGIPPPTTVEAVTVKADGSAADNSEVSALRLVHGAIRLSAHVIGRNPSQFASQMVGRLLSYRDVPAVERFEEKVIEGARTCWLRPLQPALYPPGTGLVRILDGHKGDWVNAVALSRDGRLAVSAPRNGALKVWEVSSGRELRTLAGHEGSVNGVAVSGDGRLAVSASWDKTLKVWEVESGLELHTLRGHDQEITTVAMSRDGRLAVSGDSTGTLKMWELESGGQLQTQDAHSGGIAGVAMSGDGRLAVSASGDGALKVWEVSSGRELRTLTRGNRPVDCVALSGDGRLAVSASRSLWGTHSDLSVWEVASGRRLRGLYGHRGNVCAVAMAEDGRRAVSASDDKTLKVWDVAKEFKVLTLVGESPYVRGVALSGDGRLAVSASGDGAVRVWELDSREVRPAGPYVLVEGEASSADAWLEVENHLYGMLGKTEIDSLRSVPRTLLGHTLSVNAVAVSGDGRLAVSASEDKTLKVWDVESGHELHTLEGHSESVKGVAVSRDGRLAISASLDKTLKVWDLASGRELHTLVGHSDTVWSVALSGDGRLAVSASGDGALKVWDVDGGSELRTWQGLSENFHAYDGLVSVAITQEGRLAISASNFGMLRLWEVECGHELRTFVGQGGFNEIGIAHLGLLGAAISADGRLAVSASRFGMKVWDVGNGHELHTLLGYSEIVHGVAVSVDGRLAVSASEDKTANVWEVETGACLATFTCDNAALCCALSDARELVVVGDVGGQVHFLRLEIPKSTFRPPAD